MLLTDKPTKISTPFANAGGKNTIPVASQIGITAGAASFTDGFPPLTRTLKTAGGIPPSGLDMNGILYAATAVDRWEQAGGGYPYDSAFSTTVGGYPKGARVLRADGLGYWISTGDSNTSDPDGATPVHWARDSSAGITTVALTGSNVTLTPVQYGNPIIKLSGTLTADVQVTFPGSENGSSKWVVINACVGNFKILANNTATSYGVNIPPNSRQTIISSGSSGAITYSPAGISRMDANAASGILVGSEHTLIGTSINSGGENCLALITGTGAGDSTNSYWLIMFCPDATLPATIISQSNSTGATLDFRMLDGKITMIKYSGPAVYIKTCTVLGE